MIHINFKVQLRVELIDGTIYLGGIPELDLKTDSHNYLDMFRSPRRQSKLKLYIVFKSKTETKILLEYPWMMVAR